MTPRRRRFAITAGLVALLATASGAAQESGRVVQTRMDSGLFTVFTGPDRSVLVTVAELGAPGVQSNVRIVLLDAQDRVVFINEGVLERGRPVRLELPLNGFERRVQLRASLRIVGTQLTQPAVTVEEVNANSLTIEPRIFCGAPAPGLDPVEPNCPPLRITVFNP